MNDVLIMGGGFAGLAAATQLAAAGRRVTVLEKRPVLGGRAYSYTDQTTGDVIDNGQHAMMGCYTEMFRFLERIGATDKLAIQPGLRVDMLDPTRGAGVIGCPPLPNPLHMGAGVLGYRLLSIADRVRVLAGGLRLLLMKRRGDARLAELTVDGVLDLLGQSAAARRAFWHPVAIATLNDDPAIAAADLLAEVMVRAFFAGKEAARFVLSKVGLSELYTHDARRFIEARGGRVETKAHVVGVGFRGDEVSHFELRDGRRLTASAYVSAVPSQGLFPLLPIGVRRSVPALGGIEGLASSPIVSVHVWFDRPILAERPFVGFVGTGTHWAFNRDVIAGRRDRDGGYLSFVISGARAIVDDDNDAIVARTLADLRRLVPASAAATVRHTQVVKEKFATMSPTVGAARLRPATVTPFDNFVLAGDWTDTGLPATIESAVMSGHRAADVVTARLAALGTRGRETRAASCARVSVESTRGEGRMTTPAGRSAVRWQDARSEASGVGGVHVRRLEVQTSKRMEIHDLTETVREMVRATGVTAGLVTVSTMHTTTAVFVNEPQTALLDDIHDMLERLVPRAEEWKHNDPRYSDCDRQNADAHLRAIMLGSSVTLQVAEGALTMGQWQRVLMAELDGPRKRGLVLQVLAAG